jgi:hypothetical protein
MPTQRAGRETGSFFQSDVQAEQVSTLPPARHNWPYCPDLEWDDEHEQTQPDLARLDVPHAVDAQGFAMLADSGEHPDRRIPFRLTTKGAHSDLATIDPVGWVP